MWLGKGERSVQASAAAVRLPAPAEPGPVVPAGADLRLKGLTPYVTSRDDFYRIDTALVAAAADHQGLVAADPRHGRAARCT